jgi:hypothetical protein
VLLGLGTAAQHRADAGDELARGERLGDVVVCAEFQADHLVDLGVARGHDDDRDVGTGPQAAAYLGAREPGQHHVEQHHVGAGAVERGERVGAGGGYLYLISLATQHVRQGVRERLLVLDDQDTRHAVPLVVTALWPASVDDGRRAPSVDDSRARE